MQFGTWIDSVDETSGRASSLVNFMRKQNTPLDRMHIAKPSAWTVCISLLNRASAVVRHLFIGGCRTCQSPHRCVTNSDGGVSTASETFSPRADVECDPPRSRIERPMRCRGPTE
jgi:hypothetical protein